jgi:hypothetical protein
MRKRETNEQTKSLQGRGQAVNDITACIIFSLLIISLGIGQWYALKWRDRE